MANREHVEILKRGVAEWNRWREENPEVRPDLGGPMGLLTGAELSGANLSGADLIAASLSGANLSGANLRGAILTAANLSRANLSGANLVEAELSRARLVEADLTEAHLSAAHLFGANLSRANLNRAQLGLTTWDFRGIPQFGRPGANLDFAILTEANLVEANLRGVDLRRAILRDANVGKADLQGAVLVETTLKGANLCESHVYGVSAWNVKTDEKTLQNGLIITRDFESLVMVDDLKVAQFMYLLLNNEEIRNVIDTITSKVVLILGRFSEERKAVLDALREELRDRWGYVPVLFDFEKPASKTVTGTVATLARMARFIIADLTDPSSVPHELATVVPGLTKTAVHPIRLQGSTGYGMFEDLLAYPWVLKPYEYESPKALIGSLGEVLSVAEEKVIELRGE